MKKVVYYISIILLVIVITSKISKAQENTSNEGTEFYVAFPLNDNKQQMLQTLAIYVTSRVDNKVTIFNEQLGINATKSTKANETVEFSTAKGGLDKTVEREETDTILNAGIKITSDFPVSVYCFNSKMVTSEGFMAIPTKSWGKEYIHNSFYDFAEIEGRDWGGGFVVLAKEDDTEIRIQIRDGANLTKGFGETTGGQQHGDNIIKVLNAGEIYIVQGTGTTRGIFDLSGSIITSDKPIGLISYHNRCMIPSTVVTTGRDHLIEMLPPTQAWGKEYFSVELERNTDKGDYFRVVAAEDNTTLDIIWYDKKTKQKVNEFKSIILNKKGDWYEYNSVGTTSPHDLESIRGVAHFTADKPILVCQYSYSANYDGAAFMDPFMIVLTSVEQYTTYAYSTTPLNYGNNEYRENFVRIIVKGDTIDPINNIRLLNSFKLNGVNLDYKNEYYNRGRIPNSVYNWISIYLDKAQTFNLESLVPFTASIYGFANFDSYAWPASPNAKNLINTDTLPPLLTNKIENCNVLLNVSDNPEHPRNGDISDQPRQLDLGVNISPKLETGSFNFKSPQLLDKDGNIIDWPLDFDRNDFKFILVPINKGERAKGVLNIVDKAGNITSETVYYNPDSVEVKLDIISEYVLELVNRELKEELFITNTSNEAITISQISLIKKENFRIDKIDSPIELQPDSTFTHYFYYKPTQEHSDLELGMEIDTILIDIGCYTWKETIIGQGVMPRIEVSNMILDSVKINQGISKQKGSIKITNTSSVTENSHPNIEIYSIYQDELAPDNALFSNFRIVELSKAIDEIGTLQLVPTKTFTIEFDINTTASSPGYKYTRLVVRNNSGPLDSKGEEQNLDNNFKYKFDGNFTKDNQSALDNGGFIQVNLIDEPQSSVLFTIPNTSFKMNLLSPNPSLGDRLKLNITNKESSEVRVYITNLEGKVMLELMNDIVITNQEVEFDISELKSGVYFINATSPSSQSLIKLAVEK